MHGNHQNRLVSESVFNLCTRNPTYLGRPINGDFGDAFQLPASPNAQSAIVVVKWHGQLDDVRAS